jgi:hypothetical protein
MMASNLNDTQRIILAAAGAREDRRVFPLPSLKAPIVSVRRTIAAMLKDGLVEEIAAALTDEVWQEAEGGGRTTLIATANGLRQVGIVVGSATKAPGRASGAKGAPTAAKTAKRTRRPTAARLRAGKRQTKQEIVIGLLRRGASIAEMVQATGWQPHSVRSALTAVVKGRLGLPVISEKGPDGIRRYHVAVLASEPAHN